MRPCNDADSAFNERADLNLKTVLNETDKATDDISITKYNWWNLHTIQKYAVPAVNDSTK